MAQLFAELPGVDAIAVQQPRTSANEQIKWTALEADSSRVIRTGEALWMRNATTNTLEWRQSALHDPPAQSLQPGFHAVTWSWLGRRPIGGVIGRVAAQLSHAFIWNSRMQHFEPYAEQVAANREPLSVGMGQALLLQLREAAAWGPPLEPSISGAGWLPKEDRELLRDTISEIDDYFSAWFGHSPGFMHVHVQRFTGSCVSGGSTFRVVLYLPCSHLERLAGSVIAERTADAAVQALASRLGHDKPRWLMLGHAHYVSRRWLASAGIRPFAKSRTEAIGFARSTDLPIDGPLLNDRAIEQERPLWQSSRRWLQRETAVLAFDWLVQRTGELALRQYARERLDGDWRAAFGEAFGMSVDHFIDEFEQYRAELRAEVDAPQLSGSLHQLVFFGPMTNHRRSMIERVEEIIEFFERRYDFVPSAVTFVLDFDDEAYDFMEGRVEFGGCGHEEGSLVFVVDHCFRQSIVAHEYAHIMQSELQVGHYARMPWWLFEGSAEFFALEQRTAHPHEDALNPYNWRWYEERTRELIAELPANSSALEVGRAALEENFYVAGAVAVRRLVELFGVQKLLDAFGSTWADGGSDDASRFRATYGITLDDFVSDFGGRYRATR